MGISREGPPWPSGRLQPSRAGRSTRRFSTANLKNGSALPAMTDALAKEYGTVANELT